MRWKGVVIQRDVKFATYHPSRSPYPKLAVSKASKNYNVATAQRTDRPLITLLIHR